jgi:hypothetical protein
MAKIKGKGYKLDEKVSPHKKQKPIASESQKLTKLPKHHRSKDKRS